METTIKLRFLLGSGLVGTPGNSFANPQKVPDSETLLYASLEAVNPYQAFYPLAR